MAKKGGNAAGMVILGGVALFALLYFTGGRGTSNSPYIPDKVEDRIDSMVEALNRQFGKKWVNFTMDVLQAYIEKTMPWAAALLNAVHWAEQVYGHIPNSGPTKRAVAAQRAGLLRA